MNEMNLTMPRRAGRLVFTLTLLASLLAAGLFAPPAAAQIGSERYSSIVIEATTGRVMSEANADEPRYPASLTKMMTLFVLFEALRDRRITLDTLVPVSPHAASMEPSKLGLQPGMRLTVEEAILGLVTKSANDAAAALGELLGGSEERFAQMMTLRARALGMSRTIFRNASGLPDPEQVTTARDLATLGRHLVLDFPNEYRYFSYPSFVFHGRTVYNHDLMLQRYPGADGIKTGFTEAAGHTLVTSAVRGPVRVVGVVLGARSNPERDIHMAALLDAAFAELDAPPPGPRELQAMRLPPLVPTAQAATERPASLPSVVTPGGLVPNAGTSGVVTQASRSLAGRAPMPERPRPPRVVTTWGVQVGAFASPAAAREAAALARRFAGAGEVRIDETSMRGKPAWRAQLVGMTEAVMRGAVSALARHHMPAQPLPPETMRLASN